MADKSLTCPTKCRFLVFSLLLASTDITFASDLDETKSTDSLDEYETYHPTVFIAILVRNKAHCLPWFFGHLESLDYPKDRIALWIRSDHNSDNSTLMIKEWVTATEHMYNSVDYMYTDNEDQAYPGENGPFDWTKERFQHVIKLREEALNTARTMWADYILMLDSDVFLENKNTLKILVQQNKTIIAPMMVAAVGETYSNFWGGMNEEGYYKRVPEYFDMVGGKTTGVFKVPMVHSVFLMDLRHRATGSLSYIAPKDYSKAEDDIIIFAYSAEQAGVSMYIVNTATFGHLLVPLDEYHWLSVEREQFMYLRVEAQDDANPEMGQGVDYRVDGLGLRASPHIYVPQHPKHKLGFDQVYMINLERRPERRSRMLYVFDVLEVDALYTPAVDGKNINASYLTKLGLEILPGFADPVKGRLLNDTYLYKELNIQVVPGFTDPYGGRPMTMGEIGCFLSHYFIWKDVVEQKHSAVVVFEDDLRYEPYFPTKLKNIMYRVASLVPDWDLIYLGRKRLNRQNESYLEGTESLVWPSYSYWTLSYLLSYRGAQKLLAQRPLQKLLPVDEYLPVMFDRHPATSWKEPFSPRDLVALSAEPLLIYPTHYLGEDHYISDTEYSELITDTDSTATAHNSPEAPQGPPITKNTDSGLGGLSRGLPGDQLNPSTHKQPEDLLSKDEL